MSPVSNTESAPEDDMNAIFTATENTTSLLKPVAAQYADIRKLLADLRDLGPAAVSDAEVITGILNDARKLAADNQSLKYWNFSIASRSISFLMNKRDEHRALLAEAKATVRESLPRPQVPANRYAVTGNDGSTDFYRVTVEDNGFIKVQLYVSDALHEVSGRTAMVVLRKIEADGIEAARLRFAVESKRCTDCGARLTDQDKNPYHHLGYGPKCGTRH